MLTTFFNKSICLLFGNVVSDGSMVPFDPTMPSHKQMGLLKKVVNMNLLFFNSKFLILNKFFDVLNF